jgi:nucleoside-diphosphate-sugar epimerase
VSWLVTGGAGFVGVHLLRRLSAAGIPATSLDVAPLGEELAGVRAIEGDVRDEQALRAALEGVRVVVHAAAALPSAAGLDSVNIHATRTLARLAGKSGVQRSLLVSTAVVYGLLESPVRESDEPRPIEPYGQSKLAAEREWLAYAPTPLVLRPSAVVGPERLGAFGLLFRWVSEGRRIYVLGDGSNRYQLLDVGDLVSAIQLGAGASVEGVVNVGGALSGTVREDLEALISHASTSSRVFGVPARPARAALAMLEALRLSPLSAWHRRSAAHDVVLDLRRAEQLLDWRPVRSGAEALCAGYDWYLDAGAGRPIGATHRAAWGERGLAALRRIS